MAHGADNLRICSNTPWTQLPPMMTGVHLQQGKIEHVKNRLKQAPDCWSQLIRSQDTLGWHAERLCHLDKVGVDVFHLIC